MSKPKIHKFVLGSYQPNPAHPRYVVDCKLYHMNTTPDVFWSDRKNSYILAEVSEGNTWANHPAGETYFWLIDGKLTQLLSINGGGEVRWDVTKQVLESALRDEKEPWWKPEFDGAEYLAAARHFGLTPKL